MHLCRACQRHHLNNIDRLYHMYGECSHGDPTSHPDPHHPEPLIPLHSSQLLVLELHRLVDPYSDGGEGHLSLETWHQATVQTGGTLSPER